jgi:hypothetical protein
MRTPDKMPDPWLFDTEKLILELDRCRQLANAIPCNGDLHATHLGIKTAVNAIWNLREHLRYLLHYHREGQRAFARKTAPDVVTLREKSSVRKKRRRSAA